MQSSIIKHDNPNIDFERTKAAEVNINIFESHLEYLYCKSLQTVSAVIQNALTLQNSEIMQVLHFTGHVKTVENSEEYYREYLEYVRNVKFHCEYCMRVKRVQQHAEGGVDKSKRACNAFTFSSNVPNFFKFFFDRKWFVHAFLVFCMLVVHF